MSGTGFRVGQTVRVSDDALIYPGEEGTVTKVKTYPGCSDWVMVKFRDSGPMPFAGLVLRVRGES